MRLLAIVLLLPALALADGGNYNGGDETGTNTTNATTTTNTTDNTTTVNAPSNMQNETKTFAFSNNLGDVDIGGCLGSTQWATPVFSKQGLVLNWPCMAEFYLRNGKFELAAMAICNTEIVKEFDDEAQCEAAHDFGPTPALADREEEEEDDEADSESEYEQVLVAQHQLEAEVGQLRYELEEEKNKAPPQRTAARAAPPEPYLSDTEKLMIMNILEGEGDEEDE